MSALVLHDHTARQLESLTRHPSHAVILQGAVGAGKGSVAHQLVADILGRHPNTLADYPYLRRIASVDGKAIGIEAVRELEHFLSLRVPAPGNINRVVIIDDAHLLTHEAQNALLKTLEEPPTATLLVLNTASEHALLPTIRSRSQQVIIKRPTAAQLHEHFTAAGLASDAIKQAHAVSGGLPGLMHALLTNADHPLVPATVTARELLQKSVYERLVMVDDLSKQKAHLKNVLSILQHMAHARLQATSGNQFERWQRIMQSSYAAAEQLDRNAQPKLVLDELMLNLG